MGLREQKKLQTKQLIYRVAMEMFAERGFDAVSVLEIAERAQVSKMTVFNYFPSKEDLVFGPIEEHVGDAAEMVTSRLPGESVVRAAHRVFLERLAARSPESGLLDDPVFLQVMDVVRNTPALVARIYRFQLAAEERLAVELEKESPGDLRARVAASQIMGLWRTLQIENSRAVFLGASADEAYPAAVAKADLGFGLLESGLGDYLTREG
ncbi:TetR/AcrR family transcriptional regulator [Nonomuraea sp. NPDC050556]|uniref:TetR/AcrR family transcriptional regulator n=1 Tax=Nonomuraea sp. NPDC050556 TaxID=3364369 RepID=UPI00378735E4